MRALLSVSNKQGLTDFAKSLAELGWELISTGGTAKAIRDAGIAVQDVSDVTGFPEMLDGRVKTLHPVVHGGLLARRDLKEHMDAIKAHNIAPIDLVVVNLYPFRETAAKPKIAPEDVIEQIDIGGPSMLRSAAKNFASVMVVVDPADYGAVLDAIRAGGDASALRRSLARKVFEHTAAYDAAIASWFAAQDHDRFPARLTLSLERAQGLRYGENPGQNAAFYVEHRGAGLGGLEQIGGKELSFNNFLDLEGALLASDPFRGEPGVRHRQAHHAVRARGWQARTRRVHEGARVRSRQRVRVRDCVHGSRGRQMRAVGRQPVRGMRGGAGILVGGARDARGEEESARVARARGRRRVVARFQTRSRRTARAGSSARRAR